MSEVITVRPRWGSSLRGRKQKKGYRKALQKLGMENLPAREPMLGSWKGYQKSFTDQLGPLRRYLHDQIGRPWDKVHSEICQHINRDSLVQAHVLTHLYQEVQVNVFLSEGVPCSGDPFRFGKPVFPEKLYVCPKSGLLRKMKPPHRSTKQVNRIGIDESLQYHCREGLWYEVRLRPLPVEFKHLWEALLQQRVKCLTHAELWKTYGMPVYAIAARLLKRQEVRNLLRSTRVAVQDP